MEPQIFSKMKVKPGMCARIIGAPPQYPQNPQLEQALDSKADFIHLFVSSQDQFVKQFSHAVSNITPNCLVWISYPKSSKKQNYDINRNRLWELLIPCGWHPVAQVSLDEQWSALRVKPNEPGQEYIRVSKSIQEK